MPSGRSADNIKAGLFVLVSLTLAVAIILTLAGAREALRPSHAYTVRFTMAEGAAGLESGSEVRVGGRQVGRVAAVRFSGDDAVPTHVDVEIRVDKSLRFYDDAVGFLHRPLLGAGAAINFLSLGGGPGASPLSDRGVVRGAIATPDILARAGYGPEQVNQLQGIMHRADDVTRRLDALLVRAENELFPMASGSFEDVRTLVGDARTRASEWFDRVDDITVNMQTATAGAGETIEDARQLVDRLRALVDDNREAIDSFVRNADDAGERVNAILARVDAETLGLLNDALREGRDGVADARVAIDRLDAVLVEQTPPIRRSIANFRLASDQMRLTMGEVRRAPWRLLHRPDKKELEFELLYDATRAYADAVSDLRAASESLESLSAAGATAPASAQPIESVLEEMLNAFTRYQSAEARFLRLLGESAP